MTADLISDFDYHPYEPYVREFRVPRADVLRFDADVYVCDALFDDVVLRHFAFRDEWFKINVTLDRAGRVIETPSGPGHPAFAFNCDVATPMLIGDDAEAAGAAAATPGPAPAHLVRKGLHPLTTTRSVKSG